MNTTLATLVEILLPLVLTIVSAILIPALMSWLQANKLVKDEAQAKILQSALENAAMTALIRAGGPSKVLGTAKGVALDAAVGYVRNSVPDAVKALALDEGRIRDLVLPHVQRAIDNAKPQGS
jgi:Tfp pilus assembly protein FimT